MKQFWQFFPSDLLYEYRDTVSTITKTVCIIAMGTGLSEAALLSIQRYIHMIEEYRYNINSHLDCLYKSYGYPL